MSQEVIIKTKTGIIPSRDFREYLTWGGMEINSGYYDERDKDIYTLIFKKESNPFFISSKLENPPSAALQKTLRNLAYMSFMNNSFYNLMRKSTGTLFWEKGESMQLLMSKLWHSFMWLIDEERQKEHKSVVELANFMKRYEAYLKNDGVINPCIVITFENTFLIQYDCKIILNEFNEITSNYNQLPAYKLPYIQPEKSHDYTFFR